MLHNGSYTLCLFLLNPKFYGNEIWSNTNMLHGNYFYHFIQMIMKQNLTIVNSWYLPLLIGSFTHVFKKMKHWNFNIIGYWVTGAQFSKQKWPWNFARVLQIVQMIPENYCPCLYLSIGQVSWLIKDILKDVPYLIY